MNDQELLERVERMAFLKMLEGCEMDDHLSRNKYCVGLWSVTLRADELCRLIDMAKRGLDD